MIETKGHFQFVHLLIAAAISAVALVLGACGGQESASTASPAASATAQPGEAWSADGIIKAGEYAASNQYSDYQIFWRSDAKYVYSGVKARTGGFVAIGLQPGSRMKNADMVLTYVTNGDVVIHDMFSTGDFGPHLDDTELGGSNDIVEYGGSEADNYTTIEFKRALDTGDRYDVPLSAGTNRIIWAFGLSDGLSQKHARRGYGEIGL
ncbi:MAG: DOMON domain-containing protein [Dehalococcoidales bacterium]|nr:DOMON domain-containing protein [Dehalococcoidales bacterium]